ncbi:MAG: pirin family protein [Reichenbachiella sp.]
MIKRKINRIIKGQPISVIPGVKGSRTFPTMDFKDSDPFLMMDHIGPDPVGKSFFLDGKGHDHPHRGFETLTFMFEGRMDHRDSIGNQVRLDSGAVQRMNAGKGIIHGGSMHADQETGRFHEMQLWVNNPQIEKLSEPEVENVSNEDMPFYMDGDNKVRVVTGTFNSITSPMTTKSKVSVAHVIGKPSTMVYEDLPANEKVMVYVLEGNMEINGTRLKQFELADLEFSDGNIEITISENTDYLVLVGKPLNEPIAFGGPFVMNTQEEIQQANMDFQLGKFGEINY